MTLQPLIDHFESYLPFDEREKQALEGHPARVKKLIAIGAGEQLPGLRRVIFDTNELAKLDTLYWEQLALMPEPKRIQEYRTKLATFCNTMTAGKELFASIRCPVLIMAGERDRNAPLATITAAYDDSK